MACDSGRSSTAADFGVPQLRRKLTQRKRDLDQVTRLLCSLCKQIESSPLKYLITTIENGELSGWWENHKKLDTRRKASEAKKEAAARKLRTTERKSKTLKKKALSKLTESEKKVLGIRKQTSNKGR
jgi:hypothetical protein